MLLTIFCDFTSLLVSDLVGSPKDRFSWIAAHVHLASLASRVSIRTEGQTRGQTTEDVYTMYYIYASLAARVSILMDGQMKP